MTTALTLEAELLRRSANDRDAADFLHRYSNMKTYLESEYYRWIQSACPYFTDHGEQHVNSVVQAASLLVGDHLDPNDQLLTSLDIFLILGGILWHDVGNALGRTNHAQKGVEISNEIKRLGFPSPDIHRLVAAISKAHAGKKGLESAKFKVNVQTANKSYDVRPRALAAVVRFADEISENHNRISKALLEPPSPIPPENQIYWQFANAVSASVPEPTRERVVLKIDIQDSVAATKFPCSDFPARSGSNKELSVIEYVLCRLEKMNNERAYCAPEFRLYANMREIEARFTLLNDMDALSKYDDMVVLFRDGGMGQDDERDYPNIPIFEDFFNNHPEWKPQNIEKEVLAK